MAEDVQISDDGSLVDSSGKQLLTNPEARSRLADALSATFVASEDGETFTWNGEEVSLGGGGGGGDVASVNGKTGAVVLDYSDVGAASAAQGQLADTAVQPEALAAVATSGAYTDLTETPALGTAAAANTGDFATAAQGAKADTAVQPGDDAADLGSGAAPDGYVLTADGAGGAAWEAASGGGGGGGAVDSVNGQTGAVVLDADDVGAVPTSITANSPLSGPIETRQFNFAPQSAHPDVEVLEALVGGQLRQVAWRNEWGALRGVSPYAWGDALLRAIRYSWDGITQGQFVELEDRRSGAAKVLWGRRWADGALIRNGAVMADTWAAPEGTPIPEDLPDGTVVVFYEEP